MSTIKEKVWKAIHHSPSTRITLARGLINMRALAKHIKRQESLNASLDAIISAIRRYEEEEPLLKNREIATKAIKGAKLSSKNHIASIMLRKNDDIERSITNIFSQKTGITHDMVRIVRAQKSLKIYIDDEHLNSISALFPKQDILRADRNLGEVTVDLHEVQWDTPGIINILTAEIALNNISIHEMLTCIPEIIFFFDEKDLMKAHEVLYWLSK